MRRILAVLSVSVLAACGGEAFVDEEEVAEEPGQDEQMLGSVRPLVDDGTAISREAWGARPAGTCRAIEAPTRVTIHHVGGSVGDTVTWLRNADYQTRVGKGWCDQMYHFAIARDGKVYEMVSSGRRGAHVDGQNTKNLGIVLLGNFQTETPTPQMLASLQNLLRGVRRVYSIPSSRVAIKGHFELAPTACPGTNVKSRLDAVVAAAAGSTTTPTQPPVTTPPAGCGVLASGAQLGRGQAVTSCDGRFQFVHQADGNVVLYQGAKVLWHAGTNGRSTSVLAMQGDGNLVLYAPSGTAVWHAGTFNRPGARLALQDDGNAVVYQGASAVWSTGTCCH